MGNVNTTYFREVYPKQWLEGRHRRAENASHRRYQALTLAQLACRDDDHLLECGCGSGELLVRLRAQYPHMQLTGVDLGRESLAWAAQEVLQEGGVTLIEGDITALPIASETFDRVLCSSVLWYVPDPYAAIGEMVRVLKPGGRFVFDVRPPYHITNLLTRGSLALRRAMGRHVPAYSFVSPGALSSFLTTLPVTFEVRGYFVLLPTQLPVLGAKWGNWAALSSWLSFEAGRGWAKRLAQKLLVTGTKEAAPQEPA